MKLQQFSFIVLSIALASGIIAITFSARILLDKRSAFYKSFLNNLAFFNILIIGGIGLNNIQIYPVFDPNQEIILSSAYLLMAILKFLWLFAFLSLNIFVGDRTFPDFFKKLYFLASGSLMTLLSFLYLYGIKRGDLRFFLSGVGILEFVIIGAAMGAVFIPLILSRSLPQCDLRTGVNLFGWIYFFLIFIILASIILSTFFKEADSAVYILINSVDMILFNLIPIIWIFRYGKYFGLTRQGEKDEIAAENLFRRFNITDREAEIIRLICEGKSNQDIADQLFISLHTVKDHNTNIFRKVGVKNRVQLLKTFRSLS